MCEGLIVHCDSPLRENVIRTVVRIPLNTHSIIESEPLNGFEYVHWTPIMIIRLPDTSISIIFVFIIFLLCM